MTAIDSYSFGRMTVNGTVYTEDLIITGGVVISPWRRKKGHSLCEEDLAGKMKEGTEVLVIGTGSYGVMKVPREFSERMERSDISLYIAKTGDAASLFNDLIKTGKIVTGAFHLTC